MTSCALADAAKTLLKTRSVVPINLLTSESFTSFPFLFCFEGGRASPAPGSVRARLQDVVAGVVKAAPLIDVLKIVRHRVRQVARACGRNVGQIPVERLDLELPTKATSISVT